LCIINETRKKMSNITNNSGLKLTNRTKQIIKNWAAQKYQTSDVVVNRDETKEEVTLNVSTTVGFHLFSIEVDGNIIIDVNF
jgi:hypothetical protein